MNSYEMRWLHFSDLHVGQPNDQRWANIDSPLCEDLKSVQRLMNGPIDLIFFTGDLVYQGAKDEFDSLNTVIERIYKCIDNFQPYRPLLLTVPGNHDLQRPGDEQNPVVVVLNSLWPGRPDLRSVFWTSPDSDYRREVEKSFSAYEKWRAEATFPSPPQTTKRILPGDFASTLYINGLNIGVVGLNTAFLQLTAGNFEERLAIHDSQLYEVCDKYPDDWSSKHDLCFLITHHPPAWLSSEARSILDGEIATPGRFAFHLFGHLHAAQAATIILGSADARRYIQGTSLFGLDTWGDEKTNRTHGYVAGLLRKVSNGYAFRLWPRSAHRQQAGHLAIRPDPGVKLESDGGTPEETIATGASRKVVAPKAITPQSPDGFDDSDGGAPKDYMFDYEKHIIETYIANGNNLPHELVRKGCPAKWPSVRMREGASRSQSNPLSEQEIGQFLNKESRVLVDARLRDNDVDPRYRGVLEQLTFPEARPRKELHFSSRVNKLRVGILVSGGIAPGINAVVNGIVERHHKYAFPWHHQNVVIRGQTTDTTHDVGVEIFGYLEGFKGLIGGTTKKLLDPGEVRKNATLGGSMIGTSRADVLLDYANRKLRKDKLEEVTRQLSNDLDILYVIGGDGTMRAAHAISEMSQRLDSCRELTVVGIPKTMDNDILWVWQSFGFVSAVERSRQIILQLHTEATSNPRLCVIQLFGSDSGFVVSHAVIGSGVCDLALLPEIPFTMRAVSCYIREKLQDRLRKRVHGSEAGPFGMIVMGETAIPRDVDTYIDDKDVQLSDDEKKAVRKFVDEGRRVRGQTPDYLRSASLKIVSRTLQKDIRSMSAEHSLSNEQAYWKDYRVFTNEPRHVIRSMQPSVQDVILGQRLGVLAVDNAMAGYTDFMISQWLTEFVLVPLELVVVGRKRVPKDGIFWKSVVANTGQPFDLEKWPGDSA